MKTKLCVLLVFAIGVFASCTKQEIIPPMPDTPEMAVARSAIEKTSEMLVGGNWYISSYIRDRTDKSDMFKSYELRFAPNGQLTDTRNGQSLSGKWVITYVDSLTRLSIYFAAPAIFKEVNGDWRVIEEKEGKVTLQDILKPADQLSFERK